MGLRSISARSFSKDRCHMTEYHSHSLGPHRPWCIKWSEHLLGPRRNRILTSDLAVLSLRALFQRYEISSGLVRMQVPKTVFGGAPAIQKSIRKLPASPCSGRHSNRSIPVMVSHASMYSGTASAWKIRCQSAWIATETRTSELAWPVLGQPFEVSAEMSCIS